MNTIFNHIEHSKIQHFDIRTIQNSHSTFSYLVHVLPGFTLQVIKNISFPYFFASKVTSFPFPRSRILPLYLPLVKEKSGNVARNIVILAYSGNGISDHGPWHGSLLITQNSNLEFNLLPVLIPFPELLLSTFSRFILEF